MIHLTNLRPALRAFVRELRVEKRPAPMRVYTNTNTEASNHTVTWTIR